jgi:hypothetical protein
MALQFSTGFKNQVLDTGSLKSIFDDGYIAVYDGTIPASPDDALGGATLLVLYSDNGQAEASTKGLDLEASAVNGAIAKAVAQTWKGTAAATGTGAWFRFYVLGEGAGGASTTEARIQGTVGGAGSDLFVSSTTFTSAVDYSLDLFSISIPNL